MAGSAPGFSGRQFRDNIRFVYNMAAPPVDADQVTFYWPSQLVYNAASEDDENVAFDPAATVTRVDPPPVKVPCGVEYFDAEGNPTPFGTVTASRIALTLLDEDYAQVHDASYVVVAGEKYLYRHTEPPSGLFDVGLYVMHFRAENEL